MKNIYKLVLITIAITGNVYGEEKYTSQYDNIDIKAILENDRLLNAYFKCIIDGDGCTPDGAELRRVLPEAINTGCEKCTETHIEKIKQIVEFLMKEKPEMWNSLIDKFDPDNVYRKKFKDELKIEGFNV